MIRGTDSSFPYPRKGKDRGRGKNDPPNKERYEIDTQKDTGTKEDHKSEELI
jgi:hypothetical protein